HVLDQYRAEAARVVEMTCGRSGLAGEGNDDQANLAEAAPVARSFAAVGSVRNVGRVQGKMASVEIEVRAVPGSDALFAFYRDQIGPYLSARSGRGLLLGSEAQAVAMFQSLKARLPAQARPVVDRLADLCDQRRQFDLQARLHFWLHSWLGAHV